MASKNTISIGFRITTLQHAKLTELLQPYTVSSSSIVRALLQLFIEGKCPDALTIALTDMQRAEKEGGVRKNG
jgi:hypothetical protein